MRVTQHPNLSKVNKKRGKYNAMKCIIDGHKFDSKIEGDYYILYRDKQLKGLISNLELHPVYPIIINSKKICKVILDFRVFDEDSGETKVVDIKGLDTAISKLKRKMVEAQHGIIVEVIKTR